MATWGLRPTADYEPLLLVKGDRLEPTLVLMDVGDFVRLSVFPFPVTFWRSRLRGLLAEGGGGREGAGHGAREYTWQGWPG